MDKVYKLPDGSLLVPWGAEVAPGVFADGFKLVLPGDPEYEKFEPLAQPGTPFVEEE